jgi:hypothetical protein
LEVARGTPHAVSRENRPAAHVVAAADLRKRLVAALAARKRLALLVRRQFRFAPELDAARLGACAPFAGTRADQLALELRLMRSFA